jgi:hypothetical protein
MDFAYHWKRAIKRSFKPEKKNTFIPLRGHFFPFSKGGGVNPVPTGSAAPAGKAGQIIMNNPYMLFSS